MTFAPEALIGPLASALLVGGASYVAIKSTVVRLQTQMEERDRAREKRDTEVDAKFTRLHEALGMMGSNGGGYVRRGECLVMESSVREKLEAIRTELHEFHEQVDGRVEQLERRVESIERRPA